MNSNINIPFEFIKSWSCSNGNVSSMNEIRSWISQLNAKTFVEISETCLTNSSFWHYTYDKSAIVNRDGSFFEIVGIREEDINNKTTEQPIIIQSEIGYLGIICKKINGIVNLLMQAKIEPGNVNCVQISPTLQATKSNFTRKHGGNAPLFLDCFLHAKQNEIIYDQIQSEQGSRFYQKRNRNIIILIDYDIAIPDNYKWMTLGQIKKLIEIDNLVNMDTRTVLSGIPFAVFPLFNHRDLIASWFIDKQLYNSIFLPEERNSVVTALHKLNNYKMFNTSKKSIVPLYELKNWIVSETAIQSKYKADFSVGFFNIEIEGREVRKWMQPLFKATEKALFALIYKRYKDTIKFLVRIKPEIGSFDIAELGPSIQWEPTHTEKDDNDVDCFFRKRLALQIGICNNVVLSEEGGRFYHEENRNILMEIFESDLTEIPNDYIYLTYNTLNQFCQFNGMLNIQLRNLLSLLHM